MFGLLEGHEWKRINVHIYYHYSGNLDKFILIDWANKSVRSGFLVLWGEQVKKDRSSHFLRVALEEGKNIFRDLVVLFSLLGS